MLPLLRQNEGENFFKRHLGPTKDLCADVAVGCQRQWNRMGPRARTATTVAASVLLVALVFAHMQNQALNTQINERMQRIDANEAAQQIGAPR